MKNRILYGILSVLLTVAAVGAAFLMSFFAAEGWQRALPPQIAVLVSYILSLHVLLHEIGHLLAGWLCGNKFVCFRIWWLTVDRREGVRFTPLGGGAAGEVAFYPTTGKRVKARYLVTTLGGACLNILYAALFFSLYFALPDHPTALLFFEMLAPISLAEGLCALIPASLPDGKTDGAVALGIIRGNAEETVALRILTAQGILYRGSFSEIDGNLLFDTPVVREDLPAFRALLFLRMQYLLFVGKRGEAQRACGRLAVLSEYMDAEEQAQVGRYAKLFEGGFTAEKSEFRGINELEELLAEKENM